MPYERPRRKAKSSTAIRAADVACGSKRYAARRIERALPGMPRTRARRAARFALVANANAANARSSRAVERANAGSAGPNRSQKMRCRQPGLRHSNYRQRSRTSTRSPWMGRSRTRRSYLACTLRDTTPHFGQAQPGWRPASVTTYPTACLDTAMHTNVLASGRGNATPVGASGIVSMMPNRLRRAQALARVVN